MSRNKCEKGVKGVSSFGFVMDGGRARSDCMKMQMQSNSRKNWWV